jgi:carbonic anhydrase
VSRKLLIVVAVQSALVLGLGGAAVGMSLSGSSAPPAHGTAPKKKKAKAPPPDEDMVHDPHEAAPEAEDTGHDEAAADEPPPKVSKKPARVVAKAQLDDAQAAHGPSDLQPPAKAEVDVKKPTEAKGPSEELHPISKTPKEPLEAFAWLDEGNTRWAQGLTRTRDAVALRAELAKGFAPWALIVSCVDGRVVPEAVFDAAPGAMATLKVPVLKADAATASAVELTLRKHPARVLVLLGHEGCDDGSGRKVEEQVTAIAAKVMSKKPLRDQAKAGKLLVLRATYAFETGRVKWLDSEEAAHDESAHR